MDLKRNITAAIGTAIYLYLEAERHAVGPIEEKKAPELPRVAYSPWALAGRQSMMDMRRFLQMRLIR